MFSFFNKHNSPNFGIVLYTYIYINKILYPNKLCYIKTHIIEKYKRVKMKIKYEKLILINLLKVFNIFIINCLFK